MQSGPNQTEELAILIAGDIEHDSQFPLYSNRGGRLGVLRPNLTDESLRIRDFLDYIGLRLERFAENRGWKVPEWSYERLENYVAENEANVNVVLGTDGGKIFAVNRLTHDLDRWNQAGHVTRGFVPKYAASAGASIFSHTGERHMGFMSIVLHHLGSLEDTGEIYDNERALKKYLDDIARLLGREVNLEDLTTDAPDKQVVFSGLRLERARVANAYDTKGELMAHFHQTTGINPGDYPELKAVFETSSI